ncbi:MAG: phosphoribosylanthranilate isomerase [Desulfovibrio sp.]|nr:phosphoribosylanthranilate isomerase [Desulfovibrio sp.]
MLVKFCGLTRQEDVNAANALGADMCGFIFHEPSPRHISPYKASRLQSGAMRRVGVFVQQDIEEILQIMDEARLDYAQLHGGQSMECAAALGAERVIRVIWPQRYARPDLLQAELLRHADSCAYYLLDAGLQGGGWGKSLEWKDVSTLHAPHPWLLAGGLDADKVAMALRLCHPDGLDFNSGVEVAPGEKNAQAMKAAVAALKQYERKVLQHGK